MGKETEVHNDWVQGLENASLCVKRLPYKHEDLNLVLRTHVKMPGTVVAVWCACNPITERWKQGDWGGGVLSATVGESQASKRLYVKNQGRQCLRNDTQGWPLTSTHAPIYNCAPMQMFMHTYIHTRDRVSGPRTTEAFYSGKWVEGDIILPLLLMTYLSVLINQALVPNRLYPPKRAWE